MIKIFISVRNRLAITKKCIEALRRHSVLPHQIYVYDNHSTYLVEEHFKYFSEMYTKGIINQITFTKSETTFNAFSKGASCNFFGRQHEEDPNRNSYLFLLILDNDIIVTPEWDRKLSEAWAYVKQNKLDNIKVIGQRPGGIKGLDRTIHKIGSMTAIVGSLGGSGLWSMRPNFFTDVGYLNLKMLVNEDKKHDQQYWQLMTRASKGRYYIMGLDEKLGVHCGREAGSVCNILTRRRGDKNRLQHIKFEQAEKDIDSLSFDEFYSKIINNKALIGDW